jgi:hypothetical protein
MQGTAAKTAHLCARFLFAFDFIADNSEKERSKMTNKRKRKSILKELYYGNLAPAD